MLATASAVSMDQGNGTPRVHVSQLPLRTRDYQPELVIAQTRQFAVRLRNLSLHWSRHVNLGFSNQPAGRGQSDFSALVASMPRSGASLGCLPRYNDSVFSTDGQVR